MAARLSEDPGVTVAVLEAGDDDSAHPENKIPIVCHTAQNTVYDWAYRTVPQEKSCKGLKNNVRRESLHS